MRRVTILPVLGSSRSPSRAAAEVARRGRGSEGRWDSDHRPGAEDRAGAGLARSAEDRPPPPPTSQTGRSSTAL